MKTIASTLVACGVLSLGFGSCGAASSGSGQGGPQDSGLADSTARDVGAQADTSSHFEAGGHDTGTGAPDTGDEAGSCGLPSTMRGAMCDTCIQTNCEPSWCACAAGPTDPDAGDAGSGCLQYAQCVESCVQTDAGSPTDCLTKVCATSPFTTPQQQAGHSLLDCMVQYCASDCGQ